MALWERLLRGLWIRQSEPRAVRAARTRGDLGRYEDLGLLGVGSMGEVRRVRDPVFQRTVALKILHEVLGDHPEEVSRFIEEAQLTSQLQHPGIVPVHELGLLPDGRLYFTMPEVRGHTLTTLIQISSRGAPDAAADVTYSSDATIPMSAVAPAQRPRTAHSEPPPLAEPLSLRRLVGVLLDVCEAVAFAHSNGVTHRDLKPDNVMVGDFDSVYVMDWGIARLRTQEYVNSTRFQTDRLDNAMLTTAGTIAGTPSYMAPEQACGDQDRIGPATDVYAIGAILYEIMAGQPPFTGAAGEVLASLRGEVPPTPPKELRDPTLPPVPDDLELIRQRAMAPASEHRFTDAGELAGALSDWLGGVRKREQALEIVEQARGLQLRAAGARRQKQALLQAAAEKAEGLSPSDGEAPYLSVWTLEAEAAEASLQAEALQIEAVQLAQSALSLSPGLAPAHDLLAGFFREQHRIAEEARDRLRTRRFEILLQMHNTGQHTAYLAGEGWLTLRTEPPAEVLLSRYVECGHRLITEPIKNLGYTPLVRVPLPIGSYLLTLHAPGCEAVRYPVHITRGHHWDCTPPHEAEPRPVQIPAVGTLGEEDIYVPASYFLSGGDPAAFYPLPRRRLWADGLVVRRFPVTNREYLAFLNDLVEQGEQRRARRYVPRAMPTMPDRMGTRLYGRGADGRYYLQPDAQGDRWEPDWPVCMVDWLSAAAYAGWEARKSGLPWRLPGELEWEKAARGVDGRLYPWGDRFFPGWCCMQTSHEGRRLPRRVDSFPVDESPYGVRGVAGNMRQWCGDVYRREGPPLDEGRVQHQLSWETDSLAHRSNRGGMWMGREQYSRLASRRSYSPDTRTPYLGFRIVRSFPA